MNKLCHYGARVVSFHLNETAIRLTSSERNITFNVTNLVMYFNALLFTVMQTQSDFKYVSLGLFLYCKFLLII